MRAFDWLILSRATLAIRYFNFIIKDINAFYNTELAGFFLSLAEETFKRGGGTGSSGAPVLIAFF